MEYLLVSIFLAWNKFSVQKFSATISSLLKHATLHHYHFALFTGYNWLSAFDRNLQSKGCATVQSDSGRNCETNVMFNFPRRSIFQPIEYIDAR